MAFKFAMLSLKHWKQFLQLGPVLLTQQCGWTLFISYAHTSVVKGKLVLERQAVGSYDLSVHTEAMGAALSLRQAMIQIAQRVTKTGGFVLDFQTWFRSKYSKLKALTVISRAGSRKPGGPRQGRRPGKSGGSQPSQEPPSEEGKGDDNSQDAEGQQGGCGRP